MHGWNCRICMSPHVHFTSNLKIYASILSHLSSEKKNRAMWPPFVHSGKTNGAVMLPSMPNFQAATLGQWWQALRTFNILCKHAKEEPRLCFKGLLFRTPTGGAGQKEKSLEGKLGSSGSKGQPIDGWCRRLATHRLRDHGGYSSKLCTMSLKLIYSCLECVWSICLWWNALSF